MSKVLSPQQRNTNILKIVGALVLFIVVVMGYMGQFSGPALLINGIASRQTIEQTKSHFEPDLKWKVIEDSGLSGEDSRPRFDIYTISAPYQYRSLKGELTLHFFNNQLASATFRAQGCDKLDKSTLASSSATQLEFGEDYIHWGDKKLAREMTDWIWAYA